MDDATRTVVERYQAKIAPLESEVNKYKRLVNELYKDCNEEPPYAIGDETAAPVVNATIRPDQYYGRPIATIVKDILDIRAKKNLGAISLNELFESMKAGGFHFDKDETNAKMSLSVTIAKNPAFAKLPTGYIGLAAWYPEIKKRKPAAGNGAAKTEIDDSTGEETTPPSVPVENEKPQNA
jgi:hypothetical protein